MAETRVSFLRYPLSVILGSEARVRVLRILAEHGGQLTAPDLINRTGLAPQSVRNTLALLHEAGIIERFGGERGAAVRIDHTHPLASGLFALYQAERDRVMAVLKAIQEAVDPGTFAPPIAVWIYGSAARGDDGMGSDVDVLLVTEQDWNPDEIGDAVRAHLRLVSETQRVPLSVTAISEDELFELAEADHPFWRDLGHTIALRGPTPEAFCARHRQRLQGKPGG